MRPELLNDRLLSLSNDTLAVVDLAAKSQGMSSNCQRSLNALTVAPQQSSRYCIGRIQTLMSGSQLGSTNAELLREFLTCDDCL